MATYLILNLLVLLVVVGYLYFNQKSIPTSKPVLFGLGILFILTAVFDNLIIILGIVDYDSAKILGLKLRNAPVEDFFYTIVAGLLIPVLFVKFRSKE